MNRTLLAATLALALTGTFAIAQDTNSAPAPDSQTQAQSPTQAQPRGHHRAPNPHRQAMRLSRQLSLTSDQTSKVESAFTSRDQQISAIQSDTTISPLVAQEKVREVRKQTHQQLSTILTPDQLQQMRQMHHRRPAPSAAPAASGTEAPAPPPSTN